jgi:hypothetical protein
MATLASRGDTVTRAPSFSPAAWLHNLVHIGGGYALTTERKLWLVVEHCPSDELTPLMAQIVGNPDRVEAVRHIIERRQIGEMA